jgi:hypothetical protein
MKKTPPLVKSGGAGTLRYKTGSGARQKRNAAVARIEWKRKLSSLR